MKNSIKFLASLTVLAVMIGCNKDETNPQEYKVDAYSQARVDGEAEVIFVEEDAEHEENTVHIVSGQEHANKVEVASENGVLVIIVDEEVKKEDGVVIEITSNNLEIITLEAENEAEFVGTYELESLTIDARGNSKLTITDLRAEELNISTAGGAEVYVSTYIDEDEDDFVFLESEAILVNENTVLVDDDYIVIGDSVKLNDGEWVVYGDNLQYQYCINNSNFETKGTSEIYATNAPSLNLDVMLVGTSEAEVMVLQEIDGEAKGTPTLRYVAVNNVDVESFDTKGSAELEIIFP